MLWDRCRSDGGHPLAWRSYIVHRVPPSREDTTRRQRTLSSGMAAATKRFIPHLSSPFKWLWGSVGCGEAAVHKRYCPDCLHIRRQHKQWMDGVRVRRLHLLASLRCRCFCPTGWSIFSINQSAPGGGTRVNVVNMLVICHLLRTILWER